VVTGTFDADNREYNGAAQGRWISPDPAGTGWNQYAYSTNPNSMIDPSGLDPKDHCGRWCSSTPDAQSGAPNFNPALGLFSAEISFFESGGWGLIIVGSTGGTVAADSNSSTGGGTLNMDFSAGAAMIAGLANMFQQGIPEEEDDKEEPDPEIQWGQALEPLKPGEFVETPLSYEYNLLNPGPVPAEEARNFAGGQYTMGVVGQGGLGFDTPVWRVSDNPDPAGQGSNGTYYAVVPQVGGTQSAIDLAINPNWGSAGNGGNPNSNGLGLSNAICVYLQPGTTYAIGPIASQGGAWVGGGIQIWVPPGQSPPHK
jgi:hypothetical protein